MSPRDFHSGFRTRRYQVGLSNLFSWPFICHRTPEYLSTDSHAVDSSLCAQYSYVRMATKQKSIAQTLLSTTFALSAAVPATLCALAGARPDLLQGLYIIRVSPALLSCRTTIMLRIYYRSRLLKLFLESPLQGVWG
jgi:hypothetical protein